MPFESLSRGTGSRARVSIGLVEVERTRHMLMRYDPDRKILVLTRLAVPYESIEALRATFDELEASVRSIPKAETALLVDSRAAPARNDPAFEQAFSELRRRFWMPFPRVGILMQTAVGVLHSERHAQMDGKDVCASTDARQLLAALGVAMSPSEIDVAA